MIMTVNPMAGVASPTTFNPDAVYDFRIDSNGNATEDSCFRLTFSECYDGSCQDFVLERLNKGEQPDRLATGRSEEVAQISEGGRVWVGLAAEPFHFTAGYFAFADALLGEGTFDLAPLAAPGSFFEGKNVSAIVIEVPTGMLGDNMFALWCTTAVKHDSQLEQVNRHAIPVLQLVLQKHPALGDSYNSTGPANDRNSYWEYVASVVAQVSLAAGNCEDAVAYGHEVADRFLPNVLRYSPNQPAVFRAEAMNGRPLVDDAMGAFWSAMTHTHVEDSVVRGGYRQQFPFLALPYPPESV